jgi:HlyD family secretion protein
MSRATHDACRTSLAVEESSRHASCVLGVKMSAVANPIVAASAATLPSKPAPVARSAPRRFVLARHWALRLGLPTLVVAAVAAGGARYEAKHPKPPVQYETALVVLGPIAAKVSATGAVSALVTVLVGSQVSGRIATLSVDFESPVKKGQTIATIEPSLLRAAVAQARANFASANAGVETARTQRVLASRNDVRAKGLAAEGLASKADLDAADAALGAAFAQGEAAVAGAAQAKAALDQTELNLTYATIVSPIDGIVISRSVDVGQTVAAPSVPFAT